MPDEARRVAADLSATLKRMKTSIEAVTREETFQPLAHLAFRCPNSMAERVARYARIHHVPQAEALRQLVEQGFAWEAAQMRRDRGALDGG